MSTKKRGEILTRKCKKRDNRFLHVPVWIWLTGILLFSFLLKLLSWRLKPTVSRDGCFYIRIAQLWYDIGDFHVLYKNLGYFWFPPLPSYLMKTLMHLGLSTEIAGIILNITLGALTPLIVYGIAFEITHQKNIAVCSAFLTAVNPALCKLASNVQRDMVYLFFAGLTLWLLTTGIRRQKNKYWCGAGLTCGCAILARFEALEFLIIVPVILFLLYATKHLNLKKSLFYSIVFFLCFFGSIVALSFLMHSQNELWQNYWRYFSGKIETIEKQNYTE